MNGSELRQEAEELAEVIHGAHHSFCMSEGPCMESRMVAIAVMNAGFRRRGRGALVMLWLLLTGSVIAAALGADGLSVAGFVLAVFHGLGLWLRGEL